MVDLVRFPDPGSEVLFIDGVKLEGEVLDRPNRFIVRVIQGGKLLECHLHDPGRLKELIFPGARVLIRPASGLRTKYSVTAAWSGNRWVLTDTRFHNLIARKFLPPEALGEVALGGSRIDFRIGNAYVEVKGGTLIKGNVAYFPDAPTARGAHHLQLLSDTVARGGRAILLMLIFQPDAECFSPNRETDPLFSDRLAHFLRSGGEVIAVKLEFRYNGSVLFLGRIPLCLR
ncbi:MAG: DNA/RNA nuclease SfsA [Thermoplasmataceae archaeon]